MNPLRRAVLEGRALTVLVRAGMLGGGTPAELRAMAHAVRAFGPIGSAPVVAAIRHGSRPALVDDDGALSFEELDRRSNALAATWTSDGLGSGARVGILARNHRGLLDATFASAKAGITAVFLNTDFSATQAREVCERESIDLLVHDDEFDDVVDGLALSRGTIRTGRPLDEMIAAGGSGPRPAPPEPGQLVVLTSGTSGTPKGARRPQPRSLLAPGAIMSKVPWRKHEAVYVAPPLFHGLGFMAALLTIGVGSTLVTRRRFDAPTVLDDIEHHGCTGLVVVPIMLRRLLATAEAGAGGTGDLRFVLCGGAPLDPTLCTAAAERLGPVLHNFYGSTEVAYATIADPADLAAAPGCVGRPPFGTSILVLDDVDRAVPVGTPGTIYVRNGLGFEGYTGGGGKRVVNGHIATGDVGHRDAGGRLFVDGRDDEMVVCGGENVYPSEVEGLLAAHPDILDVAVVGVADDDFGQRLRAVVVRRPGADLDEDAVAAHVRANLARFKVPRDVVFVDELPRNPSGKVLKRLLGDGAQHDTLKSDLPNS